MINRIKHSINGVEVVPVNRDSLTLDVEFGENIGDWISIFSATNKVILPEEGYKAVLSHLDNVGVQTNIPYNISIDGINNSFFADLSAGISFDDSFCELNLRNYINKDNIQETIKTLTFEYLFQKGVISQSDMMEIPYMIVQDDASSKISNIAILIFILVKDIIETTERAGERVGDLLSPLFVGVGIPVGLALRLAILLALDIVIIVLTILALIDLIGDAFDLLYPPLRHFKAMTVNKLLTKALGYCGISYQTNLHKEWDYVAVLPVPVDEQQKKWFEFLMNEDVRILNRGYPTSSDTVPTAGLLIDELCKMYNIQPFFKNNVLYLNSKQNTQLIASATIDSNFNDQDKKQQKFSIDTSKMWNTKIISYVIDAQDKMLFDNPKGSNVELKSSSTLPANPLDQIKGLQDIRINFALGRIKKETRFEEFMYKLADKADTLLFTNFMQQVQKRIGVLALSKEQFATTKILFQQKGIQTPDYLDHLGAVKIYENYHAVDNPQFNLFKKYEGMPVRMNNEQFLLILQNKVVSLEGSLCEVIKLSYQPETSMAIVDYKKQELNWAKNIKTEVIYAE